MNTRNMHKWEECMPADIIAEMKKNPIAYFVAGIVEDHGPHLATGTDYLPPYAMALEAVEKTGGIIYPVLPLAPAGAPPLSRKKLRDLLREKNTMFGPSVCVSVELCRLAYIEVLESIADIGFKICVAQAGHWPGIKLLRDICEENDYCINGMKIVVYDWLGAASELYEEKYKISHGGIIETSVIMHTCPDYYCDLERLAEVPVVEHFTEEQKKEVYAESSAKIGRDICCLAIARMIEEVAALRKELEC